ncbi:Superfamily II DNA or RNA helicase [Selenomonas ruminantium]|uniref:Superfamily II DNA or RNA helicase n=1 Tax=Selenomonas ruminantium TaxID=971 RepID=A0A1M6VS65_SELRU|nr:Superfamily II DNA or RNA helicase [Selenomonas ruminantium]
MDNELVKVKITQGLRTAFEDRSIQSDCEYRPQFVFNDFRKGRKVLASLERELVHCDCFAISVAFITKSGLTPLLTVFRDLERRNIRGRIITTDYLCFSEPAALAQLQEFSNIELRLYHADNQIGFHTKGYIFRRGDIYRIIVGSSNLTANALTRNEEWNTQLISQAQGEYSYSLVTRFEQLWNDEKCLDYHLVQADYQNAYAHNKRAQMLMYTPSAGKSSCYDISGEDGLDEYVAESLSSVYGQKSALVTLNPNAMQRDFIENMRQLQAVGAKRALLISATGTGKTYASAFAVKDFAPRRLLFIVHREQIAKQALKSYRKVIGAGVSMGLLSGTNKDTEAEYIFSTMQTMAKENIYTQFSPDAFDYIVIDEVHRAGAESYQRIINYFKPRMYLGMTATPDRSDGYDIYKLFDYNIAYEIRLQQALEEDMLCPFHYFGITDIQLADNPEVEDDNLANFARLTSDERVLHIIKEAGFYGFSGKRVKGLIFCSRNEEAEELSRKFNEQGLRTINLSGSNSQAQREEAIDRLVSDERADYLDYIFTVDIFNEGVDVPEINQVIMLRPTQSPIVFIQQLGRGLRQYADKEYVVILDFIGNYLGNNFMIPMALAGDRSYNKDNIRRCLLEGSRIIPGASTIHFDEIAKKRIFQSIDATNISDLRRIKESYQNLKHKLGRIPKLLDFDRYGEMDVICIFQNKSLGSYHAFLKKYDKRDYKVKFNDKEEMFLKFISMKWAEGKRPHELELLDILLTEPMDIFPRLKERLQDKWQIGFKSNTVTNLVNIMTANFITGSGAKSVSDCIFIEQLADEYVIADGFAKCLANEVFKQAVAELVKFGLHRYQLNYSNPYKDSGFQLYQKYEYEDVCRILNWDQNVVPLNIGGYKYDDTTKTFPVFINYDKGDDVQDSLNYHDRFINNSQLISLSKNKRTLQSDDVTRFQNAKALGIDVDLFVRKNKNDNIAKSFYYLGRMTMERGEAVKMQGTGDDAVEMFWNLDVSVREDIYDYITSENA